MCVLRRLDAVLEPSKAKVLEAKTRLDARCSAGGGGQSVAAAVR
jgi:hypothetical protein